jgi:DNA-3-methyladenine glycosylase
MPKVEYDPLPRAFYARDTVSVAKELLGKLLVRVIDEKIVLSGMIVETEAYTSDDPASHAFKGISKRNMVMFGDVGYAYVYFIYGNHYCFNAVAKDPSMSAGAVLVRALQPIDGIDFMQKVRVRGDDRITSGPGRLTRALFIGKEHNGIDLTVKGPLYIAYYANIDKEYIVATKRIGITKARDKPWRFIVKDNKYVSKQ